uniref:Coagulation factor IX n=1 Tax=Myripristis murdjan TaxID=586833 RepID=A0A667ZE95_9TELE
ADREKYQSSVFVSQQSAAMVLRRFRRYNSGGLEELPFKNKDNLERECKEEVCNMEEAREVFENDEKTMEFWVNYTDEDQCLSNPCQNEGVCEDGIASYVCWCTSDFSGKNCEIEVAKQCSVNNGGCSHFCAMQSGHVVCQCAAGYTLGQDKKSCEPAEHFSCGIVTTLNVRSSSGTHTPKMKSNGTLQDTHFDFNDTFSYEDYDLPVNVSNPLNSSLASVLEPRLLNSAVSATPTPTEVLANSSEVSNVSDTPSSDTTDKKQLPSWAFYATMPTITEQQNEDKRIVGGNEASPGEIPWQVTLMSLQKQEPFCGGSLLSEVWVITAAHCLTEGKTAAGGEHDLHKSEGTEKDHFVAEQIIHPHYNDQRSQYNHDIALLKLSAPVELSNQRRPICLGPKDFTETLLREASTSLVSGWGKLRFQGPEARKLQKLEVPYVERTRCKGSSREQITRFMFCAGYHSEPMDSCQGDSGGPHASNYKGTWFLTGIVSWGEDCAKEGKYGVYTRVSRYYPWISQTTGIRISS